jgi:pantoate--beta-alanine ligase
MSRTGDPAGPNPGAAGKVCETDLGEGSAEVVREIARMRSLVREAGASGRRVGFVPTLGALHAGHGSLVRRAAAECETVAVSIFVNPRQFGPTEDFSRYPRPFAEDRGLLESLGVRWIFAPSVECIYPPGDATEVRVGGPALGHEGRLRPGHFAGVATVLAKLFAAVPADRAYFGEKDWQQTVVVRRLVADLFLPIDIVVCPVIREPDGLAMSSRNAYLTPEERKRAVAIHASLEEGLRRWREGEPARALERMQAEWLASRGVAVDYWSIVDPDTLEPSQDGGAARMLVAGRVGGTRLIDTLGLPGR